MESDKKNVHKLSWIDRKTLIKSIGEVYRGAVPQIHNAFVFLSKQLVF